MFHLLILEESCLLYFLWFVANRFLCVLLLLEQNWYLGVQAEGKSGSIIRDRGGLDSQIIVNPLPLLVSAGERHFL